MRIPCRVKHRVGDATSLGLCLHAPPEGAHYTHPCGDDAGGGCAAVGVEGLMGAHGGLEVLSNAPHPAHQLPPVVQDRRRRGVSGGRFLGLRSRASYGREEERTGRAWGARVLEAFRDLVKGHRSRVVLQPLEGNS